MNPFRMETPPPPADPYYSNVSLLMHMEGANGSTSFVDSSVYARPQPALVDATITTSTKAFGTSSLTCNGTSSQLNYPSDAGFAFGTGDFTVEAWVKRRGTNNAHIVALYETGANGYFLLRAGYNAELVVRATGGVGSSIVINGAALPLNVWAHYACVRSAGVITLYVNGTPVGSGAFTGDLTMTSDTRLYIGTTAVIWQYYTGELDEIRITKGIARYTAAFATPTLSFPNY